MIRTAQIKDLQEIKSLTEACAQAMIKKHIYQWNEHYPSLEKLEADILKKELFVLEEGAKIIGIIVITPTKDEEYIPIVWLSKTENNLYIHRLATHPDHWGKGYAQKLMDFAEDYAKQHKYESVRLDTFSQNLRNQRFYEARGYQRLGNIFFPKQSEHPFYCYELLI
ncbi:ribosomal protein S18 acetylase RimI-like enzyme [Christiangramia gaetbulicola]|uniref:Ribosomal protein S18 acetylase RimI-like enzyme n=1 Tax=Christiangramia gaetbulicola TaxID=703340 RepID=A0A2T6AMB2_9FLAO|nr:GNAT family N-acetyltransferase [Christiangramia gaetbulicola]PTX44961.1 ribosomal protein S18 acetylase RimI-like enzyme [Christiangramia gaetbulicola]